MAGYKCLHRGSACPKALFWGLSRYSFPSNYGVSTGDDSRFRYARGYKQCRGGESPPDFEYALLTNFRQHPYRHHPAEHFLNPLPSSLADLVAAVPRHPPVHRGTGGPLVVLRHARSYVYAAHLLHEVFGVVTLSAGIAVCHPIVLASASLRPAPTVAIS